MNLRLTLHDKGRFQDLFEKYGTLCKDNTAQEPYRTQYEQRIMSEFWKDFENMLGDMFEVTCEEIPDTEAAPLLFGERDEIDELPGDL